MINRINNNSNSPTQILTTFLLPLIKNLKNLKRISLESKVNILGSKVNNLDSKVNNLDSKVNCK